MGIWTNIIIIFVLKNYKLFHFSRCFQCNGAMIVGKYIMMSLYSFRNCWWVFLASFTVSANTFYFYRKVQNHCHILTKRAEGSVVLIVFKGYPPSRPTERGSQPGWGPMAHEFKQVESCFLNHNLSIHFCCTDSSLLMTHRGGLSLSIIISTLSWIVFS
jgi:hypothetical protein